MKMQDQLDKLLAHKLALDAVLQDAESLSYAIRFYNLVMTWLVRLVDPKGGHPWRGIG